MKNTSVQCVCGALPGQPSRCLRRPGFPFPPNTVLSQTSLSGGMKVHTMKIVPDDRTVSNAALHCYE